MTHTKTLERFDTWIANRKWAEGLTDVELARQLTIELWSVENFYTKNCAILEEAIDRLTAKEKEEGEREIDLKSLYMSEPAERRKKMKTDTLQKLEADLRYLDIEHAAKQAELKKAIEQAQKKIRQLEGKEREEKDNHISNIGA